MQRARGVGRIAAQVRDGRTELSTLYQEGCAKIRLPHTHDPSLQAVLINTTGGLCGGDDVAWQAEAPAGARMVLTTQACERAYRSTGPAARIANRLTVGAGAHVDWLPQETILFDRCHLARSFEVDLAEGASLTAVEAVLLGRAAMGETAERARFTDSWRICRAGRLVHAEETAIGRDPTAERGALSLLAGAGAFATVLHIGPRAGQRLDLVRDLLPDGATAAASLIGDRLVVRAIAANGLALRRLIVPVIAELSGAGALPRLWST